MSKIFIDSIQSDTNYTTTENGAVALKSTNDDLLDLYASIGALRNESEQRIISKFTKSFASEPLLTMKLLFYARDIRSGLGERKVFRIITSYLANNYPEIIIKNIKHISEFGRWDDSINLISTNKKVDKELIGLIENQLADDLESDSPSLLAKWMPSENTSSKATRELAKKMIDGLKLKPKEYRKMLSLLRKQLSIVERSMSSKRWKEINYSHVPSKAMTNYRTAFYRNDEQRFEKYIEALKSDDSLENGIKINASTLYPYDLIEKIAKFNWGIQISRNVDEVVEAQWKALPNYVEGEHQVIVMADTSGSMSSDGGRPMATSIGLALYFAERNKGCYHNKFMTFSNEPRFCEVKGNNLNEKIMNIESIVSNTNLEAGLILILDTAIRNKLSSDDLPKALVVITDMQFNEAERNSSKYNTLYEKVRQKYNEHGYQIPNIIFWNVASRKDTFQATSNQKGVQIVSGQSASIFKTVLGCIGSTPYEAMLKTLEDERYSKIEI